MTRTALPFALDWLIFPSVSNCLNIEARRKNHED